VLRFATPADAIAAIDREFGPKDDLAWRFDRPLVLSGGGGRDGDRGFVEFHAATTRTMHFGTVRIDLASGETRFIDEDHRDGGDFELKRVTLPANWLAALRAVLHRA
jgi:hypothetical protein